MPILHINYKFFFISGKTTDKWRKMYYPNVLQMSAVTSDFCN